MTGENIEYVEGTAVPLRGDEIDTDRIIPARYLRCVTFDGLEEHAFADDRIQDPNHPFNNVNYQGAKILFTGANFGCGSSREHAPQSLMKWGIQGIVGESFAEIFFGNCTTLGIPVATVSKEDMERLFRYTEKNPGTNYLMDLRGMKLECTDGLFNINMPDSARTSLLEGSWNPINALKKNMDAVREKETKLPYNF